MILLLTALATSPAAAAGPLQGVTYCVGGYDIPASAWSDPVSFFVGDPKARYPHACNAKDIQGKHSRWHLHSFVEHDGKCFSCWDELDSTCSDTFLAINPDWTTADRADCASMAHDNASIVTQNVTDGLANLKPPPPPPPPPTVLKPVIDAGTGPFGAGNTVRVTARLVDSATNAPPLDASVYPDEVTFEIADSVGTPTNVVGHRQPDGSYVADVHLPPPQPAGLIQRWLGMDHPTTTVAVVVDPTALRGGATLQDGQTRASTDIKVTNCPFQAAITSPVGGATFANGTNLPLVVSIGGTDLSNANLRFRITFDDPSQLKNPSEASTTLSATGDRVAWTPPAVTGRSAVASIVAEGILGQNIICASVPTEVLIRAGEYAADIALTGPPGALAPPDTLAVQDSCIVGTACAATVGLTTLSDASTAAREALADTGSTIEIFDADGTSLLGTAKGGSGAVPIVWNPETAGGTELRVRVTRPDGTSINDIGVGALTARAPVKLALPARMDFGAVAPDTWVNGCQTIDLFGGGLRAGDAVRFETPGVAQECGIEIVLREGENVLAISGAHPLDHVLTSGSQLRVCAMPGACGADPVSADARLSVTPLAPQLQAYAATTQLVWSAERTPWWAWDCHGRTTAIISGVCAILFAVGGYLRAVPFPENATIRMSTKRAGLDRASVMVIRDQSGAGRRLWRASRISVDPDGSTYANARRGVIELRADASAGVRVRGAGLERLNQATGHFEPVSDPDGAMPAVGDTYRAGGSAVYFRVDSGA